MRDLNFKFQGISLGLWAPLLVLIGLKLFSFLTIVNNTSSGEGNYGIGVEYGDTKGYYEPWENFIENGAYASKNDRFLRVRMPHTGLFYFVFYQVFGKENAYNAVVVFQLILEILSSFFLSLLIFRLSQKRFIFWLAIFLIGFSWHISVYTNILLSESISISFLIFSLYFFFEFLSAPSKKHLFWTSSFFFAYTVLLKPYLAPIYAAFGLFFLLKSNPGLTNLRKIKLKKPVNETLLFFLPFIVLLAPWSIYNSLQKNKFEPFYDHGFSEVELAKRKYLAAVGGSFTDWDPKSPGTFFSFRSEISDFEIPEYFISDGYGKEDLLALQTLTDKYYKEGAEEELKQEIITEFNRITQIYKKERPLNFYFLSPLRIFYMYVFDYGGFNFKKEGLRKLNPVHYFMLFQFIFYFLVLFLGTGYLFFKSFNDHKLIILAAIPVFLLIYFPFVINADESRYLIHAHPIGIIGLCLFVEFFLKRLKEKDLPFIRPRISRKYQK